VPARSGKGVFVIATLPLAPCVSCAELTHNALHCDACLEKRAESYEDSYLDRANDLAESEAVRSVTIREECGR